MNSTAALEQIRSRIVSRYTLLFLKTWEEDRWESSLSELALEIERGLVVWTVTEGAQPPPNPDASRGSDPLTFLDEVEAYPPEHLFLIKDFHPYLSDPRVVRKLRDLSRKLGDQKKTLLFMGPVIEIPVDLQKEAFFFDLPLPGIEEIRNEFAELITQLETTGQRVPEISPEYEEKLVKAVLGLTSREARKALQLAISGRDELDDEVFKALVAEKRHLVQGSDLLEFYDLDEGVKDVGGLEVLKDWLQQRSEAFSERAREQGIPRPKGVLLLGVQGCGKSLTARATARLLSFPLVRLDVANLLSGDRGASERNLRDVLRLMETIAPAVLWLDEIEKGFAGGGEGAAGGAGQDAVMTRLVGSFLTWMESRKAAVFVVATANSIAGLPPEMLRRGRFDELFFVDLPNYHERMHILGIHLGKRGWKPEKFDLAAISNKTEGYSGAELEQIVSAAMIDAFGQGRVLTQEDLDRARDQLVPLSVTMEEKVFQLREWANTRCRRATSDSRVTKMIEEEQREASFLDDDEPVKEQWMELAEHGQLNSAVMEYLRRCNEAPFPKLQDDFAPYLETSGEQGLALRADPNIVLWSGMSQPFAELLSSLISQRRIYL
ncbi:MAG: AAA family ATPase, partial [Planctomycetes bacterium]|nr:AAA family ATPase [Planctomycetota bacterium]